MGSGRRVLVVDDYADAREMLRVYFESLGYEVEEAVDGADALAKVRTFKPDAILMDIAMPVMDGVTASAAIKGDASTARIPIIAVTGQTSDPNGLCPPCDDVLLKPVSPERVRATVERLLAA